MGQDPAILIFGLLAGCSWIYNPDHISRTDGGDIIDAEIDAALIRDADPSMLIVDDVWPKQIYEGQGAAGSRPVTLVIHGHNFIDGFTVDIEPSTNLSLGTATRSADGDYIAVSVTANVDPGLGKTSVPLTITVNEPGAPTIMLPGMLTKEGLAELDASSTLTPALPLDARYSEVVIGVPAVPGTLTLGGTNRIAIVSMSQISIGTIAGMKGANATTTTLGAAGPGGCAGGGQGAMGGCSGLVGGGGIGGSGGAGGGGGGFGTDGIVGGGGSSGGAAGTHHGDPGITTYDGTVGDGTDTNQASGGGGGGAGTTSSGGAGGGGGGTIELDAGGNITVGTLSVVGGNGGAATALLGAAGGGGGGAGGLVILRTDTGTITTTTVTATGGSPGGGVQGGSAGGNGGVGRVRWNGAQLTAPSSTPGAHRSPSFDAATPTIVTIVDPSITMVGTDSDTVDFYVIDKDGVTHTGEPTNQTFQGGTLTITASLLNGYNMLCATARPGVRGGSLADTCIEIAYLP